MYSSNSNFLTLALAGEVLTEEIDDFVDLWHADPKDRSLHDFLGMTRDEYALWFSSPDSLPLILISRRSGIPLHLLANDNVEELRLAARADNTLLIKRLQTWLKERRS